MATITLTYSDPKVTVSRYDGLDEELQQELFAAAEHVLGRKPDHGVVTGFAFTMAQQAPPKPTASVYTLEHRGEKFRMHGIANVVVNSAFSCRHCKEMFALDAVVALFNYYIDKHSPCRDVTCCQPGATAVLTAYLPAAIMQNTIRGAPKPKSMDEHLPGEPGFEHEVEREAPAVCRWCKGAGEVTINFKTEPCDCVRINRSPPMVN